MDVAGTSSSLRALAAAPRWHGAGDRLEVWYATFTDPATGTGVWIHHETVAPPAGEEGGGGERSAGPAFDGKGHGLGWITVFPPEGPPVTERFGPAPVMPADRGESWFAVDGVRAGDGRFTGRAGRISWDLRWSDASPPLWTFPRIAWARELLPAAQVVLAPTASFSGDIRHPGGELRLNAGRGGVAHIYGHGNAARWAWLHADLGEGDVLELVTAVSRSPGLNALPPLAFVRFRLDGRDWPRSPLPALGMRTELGLERWSVRGRIGGRRVRIDVRQPLDRCVSLAYADPDGAAAVCTNTERADVDITIEKGRRGARLLERAWHLEGVAHSEVGLRHPEAPPVDEHRADPAAGAPAAP